MILIKIKRLIIFIYTILISIRPIKKAIISLVLNRNAVVSFKSRYNKYDNIILNRIICRTLYYLLKVERYNIRIIKLGNDKATLRYINHIFEVPTENPEILDSLIIFIKLLHLNIILVTELNKDNVEVKIKNLMTLKAPLSLLAPAISSMLSRKYYETWYWDVDVKDKVVVDVGAYIGDSALFFASRGAKIVYAYEPSKRLYEIAKKNCSQRNNILLYNYGLGCLENYAILAGYGIGMYINNFAQNGEKVILKNFNEELRKIIEKEGEIDVLKLDCEGCEWEFLKCLDKELIKYVQTIVVEIHGKDHNVFLNSLKRFGFKVIKRKKLFGHEDISMHILSK